MIAAVPVIAAAELTLGEEAAALMFMRYLPAGLTYNMFKKAAMGAVVWDAPIIFGAYKSYTAYHNSGLVVTSTPSPGVTVDMPNAPKKRKAEHPLRGVKKALRGEFGQTVSPVVAMTSDSDVLSQLYSSIAQQIMDIPLSLKGRPIHLGTGDKPQKTPRSILDLFPRYYETRDRISLLQAIASPPGKQGVVVNTFNTKDKMLQLFTRSVWTADQSSPNVSTTDYSVLPPLMLARLGYPSGLGPETVVAQSHNKLGMWYTHTNKIEYFNPSNVCAYVTMQVHTYKARPAINDGVQDATHAQGANPVDVYTTWRTDRGDNRFYVSVPNSEIPATPQLPADIATVAPAADYITEVDRADLSVIGTKVRGKEIDRWFRSDGEVKFILPPGATFTIYIRKPSSFLDAGMATQGASTLAKHTYFITTYWHGQLGFSGPAAVGGDINNWGEVPAYISQRSSTSDVCRFHSSKGAEGMNLVSTQSYITTSNIAHIVTGDQNPLATTVNDS